MKSPRYVFFYGTLQDPDVLSRVLQHPVPRTRLMAGTLLGYQRVYVQNRTYPTLIKGDGEVSGLVFKNCTPIEWARLCAFESSEYNVETLSAQTADGLVDVQVYMPGKTQRATDQVWSLDTWRRAHKRSFMGNWR